MGESARKGDFIKTFTGIQFYPLDPKFSEINIRDIAHALSNICRFAGHSKVFYSVAQHSYLGAREFMRIRRNDLARIFLLHDAAEAYFGDLSRPMKRSIEGWLEIETRLQDFINTKYDIHYIEGNAARIKEMDNSLLYTEGDQLMEGGTKGWHDAENVKRLPFAIHSQTPEEAEENFLAMFEDLFDYPQTS